MTVMWVKIINYQFIHSIKFKSNGKIISQNSMDFPVSEIHLNNYNYSLGVTDRIKSCHNLPP